MQMKKISFLTLISLMFCQVLFFDSEKLHAETVSPDTLSWVWDVNSLVSTHTKTCTLTFSDSLIIDWGDGSKECIPDLLSSKTLTHIYTSGISYSCSATGRGITGFKAESRRIISIDTHATPYLNYLNCTSDQVTSLNLTNNLELLSLYCGGNELSSLNLLHNTKLQTLTCSDNKLKSLDVSPLPALKKVIAHTNPLTRINICALGSLSYLSCLNCSLDADELNSVFDSLPILNVSSASKNLFIANNPGSSGCQVELAINKNWNPDVSSTKSYFYIPSVVSTSGDSVQLDICLKNPIPAIAFEMDLVLPDGFVLDTLKTCLSSARKGNHILSIARMSDSIMQYKFLCFSMKKKDILSGDSGSVLKLYTKVPVEEKNYIINIKNAILVDTATNVLELSMFDGKLEVTSAVSKGDANGDKKVDVTDIVYLVAYINGKKPDGFYPEAADMDGNGVWNIADITKMVVMVNESNIESQDKDSYNAATVKSGTYFYLRQPKNDLSCLELCMDNSDTIQAYQVDVILPMGVSLSPERFSTVAERVGNHLFAISKISDTENRYRLLSYALRPQSAILGDTGAVVRLPLILDKDICPGVYAVTMKQPVLADMDMNRIEGSTYTTNFAVVAPSDESEPVSVGCNSTNGLWIHGHSLRKVSIYDLSGRLFFNQDLQGVDFFSTFLPSGVYIVNVNSDNCPDCVKKTEVL
jgi:hypothetical protein